MLDIGRPLSARLLFVGGILLCALMFLVGTGSVVENHKLLWNDVSMGICVFSFAAIMMCVGSCRFQMILGSYPGMGLKLP